METKNLFELSSAEWIDNETFVVHFKPIAIKNNDGCDVLQEVVVEYYHHDGEFNVIVDYYTTDGIHVDYQSGENVLSKEEMMKSHEITIKEMAKTFDEK